VAPQLVAEMHQAWQAGDIKTAQIINARLMPLHDAMFCEASPGPVKYAAELLGICSAETRLPLCEIAEDSKAQVKAALQSAGLLN
jgi:4-hydroxy-tetrahydrodipicolinate synthase